MKVFSSAEVLQTVHRPTEGSAPRIAAAVMG